MSVAAKTFDDLAVDALIGYKRHRRAVSRG
jgi:hypothetical protein